MSEIRTLKRIQTKRQWKHYINQRCAMFYISLPAVFFLSVCAVCIICLLTSTVILFALSLTHTFSSLSLPLLPALMSLTFSPQPKPPHCSEKKQRPLFGACRRVLFKACWTLTTFAPVTIPLWLLWSTRSRRLKRWNHLKCNITFYLLNITCMFA